MKYKILLDNVISKRRPDLIPITESLFNYDLKAEQINMLQDVISDELVEHGFREDDEPNDYGKMLDDLIGYIGMLRDKKKEQH